MKKAQVTIFIILGLIIFSVFIFVFTISSGVSSGNLENTRRAVTDSTLDTSALERFMSICMEDALKSGLRLAAMQGGYFTQHQFGSNYSPPHHVYGNVNVSYAIVTGDNYPPKYPCIGSFAAPNFCNYSQNPGFFGKLLYPTPRSLQSQLESYVAEYVRVCIVHNETRMEIVGHMVEEQKKPKVRLFLTNYNVQAKAQYPVKITRDSSSVKLITFESNLNVRFKRGFEAVSHAVRNDYLYGDYDFSSSLFDTTYNEVYQPLSSMQSDYIVEKIMFNNATLFILNDTAAKIDDRALVYYVARENRPPALEYVNKNPSPTYDYLLIDGETVTLSPTAVEPDEQGYDFYYTGDFGNLATFKPAQPGRYTQTVHVTDGVLEDFQEVRLLSDKVLEPSFEIVSLYDEFPDNIVSYEDPFYLDASATKQTLDPHAKYIYKWHAMVASNPEGISHECSVYPGYANCDDNSLPKIMTLEPGQFYGNFGITLTANLTYNGRGQEKSATNNVVVVQCIPHKNPNDNPAPYNTGNPYLADHSCCLYDAANPLDTSKWRVAPASRVCHEDNYCVQGYYLASFRHYCDGTRGNVCAGAFEDVRLTPLTCGYRHYRDCAQDIHSQCEGKKAWDVTDGVACYGNFGCNEVCSDDLVDTNSDGKYETCGCDNSYSPCKRLDGFSGVCRSNACT